MIGALIGEVISSNAPDLILNVGGVGYEVSLPIGDFSDTIACGKQQVTVYTHLVIRDDGHLLFGFTSVKRRDLFRTLIKVSGIGPRIALSLLSSLSVPELELALLNSDVKTLCRTPGVGKKMAERMILELSGKLCKSEHITENADSFKQDVALALSALGYSERSITNVISKIKNTTDISTAVKEALTMIA